MEDFLDLPWEEQEKLYQKAAKAAAESIYKVIPKNQLETPELEVFMDELENVLWGR